MQARYQDAARGQFLSEDPVFLSTQQNLSDPQSLNSYSYANDNPITKSDPSGRDATTYSVGLNGELGFGSFGGGSASIGFSIVYDPKTGQRWVAFPVFSYGGTAGTPKTAVVTAGKDQSFPFIIGAYGGPGVSFGYSPNVTNPSQLLDGKPQDTTNLNAPFVSMSASGEGTDSATYTVGPGAKGLASVSRYPTRTIGAAYSYSTISNSVQAGVSRAASAGAAVIQGIQAQIASIKAQLSAYVASTKATAVR